MKQTFNIMELLLIKIFYLQLSHLLLFFNDVLLFTPVVQTWPEAVASFYNNNTTT